MLVAVEETAVATGKKNQGETGSTTTVVDNGLASGSLRLAMPFAILITSGIPGAFAQVVADPNAGANRPSVVQTANGIQQVNIARPSGAGVSVNGYTQFDVPKAGVVLNNSPTIVQTQQAGFINGNPNFAPNQSARVIVNQVNSRAASQINGYVEVAGNRAEVVIANGSGISVNGGGFINTSRAILTTGTPNFAPDGSLAGFNVTGGNISVQGSGLNASNVDQVDLIARAVQANAAIYAKNLNVVTGTNNVNHDTLNVTPIAGSDAAPGVSIDVSSLGGMYANRIVLVGTENGVGVSNNGVLAAQAGDLVLTTQGKLVQAGRVNASGNVMVTARDGIDNSGTTYAQQNVGMTTAGALTNSGTLAAQQNTAVNVGSINSTGTLGAGVNSDGTVANSGDLLLSADGALTATGNNVGGGNAALQGASVNLAGSNTSANGALVLIANRSDVNLSGATATAGGALVANAAGTLAVNQGKLLSGGVMQLAALDMSSIGGQIASQSTLDVNVANALANRQGVIQSAGRASIHAGSIDNTAGRIVSLNGDGMTLSTTGALVNAAGATATGDAGGTIGTNGTLSVTAGGTLANQGQLNAADDATVTAQSVDNHAGNITAGGTLNATTTGALNNTGGTLSAASTKVSAASVDNTNGTIEGVALDVSASGDLTNRGGKLTQYGTTDQTIRAGGTLDNANGTIASNAKDLHVGANGLDNNAGVIQHAGTGALTVAATGAASNAAGTIITNGALDLHSGGALNNRQGNLQAANGANLAAASLDNTAGRIVSLSDDAMTLSTIGALVNASGTTASGATGGLIGTNGTLSVTAGGTLANQGQLNAADDAKVTAQSIDNHAGNITAGGALNTTATGAVTNAGGTLSAASTTVSAASIDNSNGTIEGDTLSVSASGDLSNRGGKLTQYGTTDQTISAGGALDNTNGTIASNANNLQVAANSVTNDGGLLQHAGSGALTIAASGAVSNAAGKVVTNGALTATAASLDNNAGTLSAQKAAQFNMASDIANRTGTLYGHDKLSVSSQGAVDNTGGSMQSAGDLNISAGGQLTNAHGTLSANGGDGAVSVTAASLDNTAGKLTNAGDGATIIKSSTAVTNTGGTLGGNGDFTLNAQSLTNDAGANLVAGGALNLNVAQRINNAGGTLYGGTALALNQASAAVINNGGSILGGLDASLVVASLSNVGGSIRANRDIVAGAALTGDGNIVAGRNLTLNIAGDYTNTAANNLHADGNMTVNATGTLTNTGTLAANGALTATGANIVNTANGDINSSTTTVNAAGLLSNAGRIEGDTVSTRSATLANTGTVIGNNVTVAATDVQNSGAAAVIAGASSVHVYAGNSVTNADGALIYSAGNLEIARDGTRDSSGMLANQTNVLTNSAANIEADGSIDIAAHTLNNLRTGVVTQAGTPQDAGTQTLTVWTAGIPMGDLLGSHSSASFSQWTWTQDQAPIKGEIIGKLAIPISVTVPKSQVTNLNTATQTFSLTQPLTEIYTDTSKTTEVCNTHDVCQQKPVPQGRDIATNPTQWYNSIADNGDTYTITFWPDFDPNRNIRPDQVQVRTDLGPDSHDYNEINRTVHTTTTTDQLINAGHAATIQAQGAVRINADGGAINNQSSTMSAGGNMVRRATGGSVNDTGIVLQQTITQTEQSTFYWHQKTGGSNDTQTIDEGIVQTTTTVASLPAIVTSNQNVQTSAQNITIGSVNSQGQTVVGSGVTGGSADGTQTGMIGGQAAGPQSINGTQAGSVSGQPNHPQTVGGAAGGIPNLTLPVNGLYSYNTAPTATYLVATDARFTQYTKFVSSDYMLGQLGLDPSKLEKRVGDGLYEETLVRNQITQLTGRTFLAGYDNNLDEYTALMNNGVTYAQQFGLEPGVALTAEQMQQLTKDMVWLVSQDVTLPDGSHQTVLVPQVYLAQSSTVDLNGSGALVAGNNVSLNATGDVNNSGHIVSNVATTVIGNNITNSGIIGSAGTTAVAAVQDVRNTSGRIGGGDVVVQAGRDVINETQTYGVSKSFGSNTLTGSVTGTGLDAIGSISATGSATVIAGRDVTLTGATIQAGGNAAIAAGRDLNLGTTTLTSTQDVHTRDGQNGGHDEVTQNLGSAIVAGGNVATVSGRDTTLTGATVAAGGSAAMVAGGDLTVTAAKDTHTHNEQSLGGEQSHHTSSSYDEAVVGSSISAGGDIALAAGQNGSGNLAILGSSVTTDAGGSGGVKLVSSGDITIGSVAETHDSQSWSENKHSGFLSEEKVTDSASSHQVVANGSTVAGDTVTAVAGHDLSIIGSTVAATHDVTLGAGNNLTITTSQDTSESSQFHEDLKTGLGSSGGAGISYGSNDKKDTTHDSSVTNNASLVGSTGGSVYLAAGNDLHVTGSDLIAAKDIVGTGANVIIDSATGSTHHDETHEVKTSGFTLGLGGTIGNAINTAISESQAASHSENGRAEALHSIAAAGAVLNAGMGQALSPGQKPDISVQLSFGTSQSKNTFTEDQTTQTGSSVMAGGTAAFVATGNGTPGSGNVTIAGSNVSANDVLLAAKNQVNLLNSTSTDKTRSTNESSSASVGVSYGTSGFGVSASMSQAHGDSNSDAVTQTNTHVQGSNSVTIVSGGDTNIVGANVSGSQVMASIGGNLNIASVQDTTQSAAHQSSSGGGFSISQAGGSASISSQHGSANGSYAAVNEQAGIQAGSGGFDINVKGNTDLKGAYIASDADALKNTLTTGTLTWSDIQNHSNYNASSSGITIGGGGVGIAPMISQSDSNNEQATTKSGVSSGAIVITDAGNQKQDVATLNRDTTDLNGRVSKLPDVNDLISQQQDVMNAANAAGTQIAQAIGTYSDYKENQAKSGAKAATLLGETDEAAAYNSEAATWGEGGSGRVILHVAGGAVLGGLGAGGVGGAVGGAAGAGVSSAMAGHLNDLADAAGAPGTIEHAAGNALANLLATAAGAAVGGSAGAFTAANADLNNRQLHPDEKTRIHELAGNDSVEEARLTAAACAMVRCYAEYPEGSAAYQQLQQIAEFGASDALAGERDLLSKQTGMFGYTTTGIFSDANMDATKQLNNTYQLTIRGAGAAEATLGALGIAGALTSAPLSCATGVGCVANALVAGTSADALVTGSKQVISGQSESTYLNQALTGLGMSPAAAGLLETALGIGSAATAGAVANQATAQAALLNTASLETYTGSVFSPQGVKFTSDMIESNPVVRAIYQDYFEGLGGNAQSAELLTGNAIRSGQALPTIVQLGRNDELVRLVPIGDSAGTSSYYMSRAQYDSLVGQNLSATSVANALGLPTSSYANGGIKGFQAFSIEPQPGKLVSVYQSTIAPVSQGQYSASGGLTQYIVPNLSVFTSPKPIPGGIIR
ncbi:hemagglutinin repeat-containing protein [Paraburkholderia rhizosphaerae]|uniref:Filamentous hemagglutinin n=2 Tax=Paraburkholderia rhizosphaerae TaxID=480658 RepID=A0A4R8L3C3_9BURK|nr:filamentous hemagglutinin [Paraburkholderia rhizosphaerae]